MPTEQNFNRHLRARVRRWSPSATVANPTTRVFAVTVAAGAMGGAIGAAYLALLHLAQRALWPTHWGLLAHGVILVAVGACVGLLTWRLGSPGDVELLVDNIHVAGGARDLRQLPSLLPVSLLCIASGGGLGPEAPLVQTTGSVGSWTAREVGLGATEMRVVTITGMAAGFTVLFGTPLGASLFALEILHRRGLEYYEALLPAVIGSLTGFVVHLMLSGSGLEPIWVFPVAEGLHGIDVLWAAGCGVVGAGIAVAFTYLNQFLRHAMRHVRTGVRPALGGLGLALLAWWTPYALTFGEDQLGHVALADLTVRTLLVAAAGKLIASSLTLASGWKGGFIIPLFFVGACLARAADIALPHTNVVVLMAALMVACNVGVTKTPIGSVVVVTEMAGLNILPTTLVASVIALVLTSNVGLIETQRRRNDPSQPAPAHG